MLTYSTRNKTVTKKDEISLPSSDEEIAWIHFHQLIQINFNPLSIV
jgi:hypothetical protein